MYISFYESPIGWIELCGNASGLTSVWFKDEAAVGEEKPNTHTEQGKQELKEYFEGKREVFSVALDATGSPFQLKVWDSLLRLPFGKTQSYLELAISLGDENLTRAVGMANGKNPIGIIVPCHRIIGVDGSLTGYAGGLERKKWLLRHEGVIRQLEMF